MDKIILEELANLIQQGEEIHNSLRLKSEWKLDRDIERWEGAALNLLKVRFGKKSDFFIQFKSYTSQEGFCDSYRESVRRNLGVLDYIHDALGKGLIEDLFYKKEIILFSNLLEQAFEFLDKGFKFAAGIYGRIVLETTIKEFAKKNDILENKFDQTIIKLRTEKIIQKPFENSLRANYEIGSWAAHGNSEFQDLSEKEVKEFLVFVRDKVLIL